MKGRDPVSMREREIKKERKSNEKLRSHITSLRIGGDFTNLASKEKEEKKRESLCRRRRRRRSIPSIKLGGVNLSSSQLSVLCFALPCLLWNLINSKWVRGGGEQHRFFCTPSSFGTVSPGGEGGKGRRIKKNPPSHTGQTPEIPREEEEEERGGEGNKRKKTLLRETFLPLSFLPLFFLPWRRPRLLLCFHFSPHEFFLPFFFLAGRNRKASLTG